ncbi:N-acetyltransferase [Synechococcus sp. BS55D]|uniref:N-acetyltransferase n=1 Tax=Synechococcus sp. BS55D TaxID=2055943 RepID=UPI00103F5626|nr:N-acetyltransferase [Synechococcus sp. BS55D]TCD55714.1 GNAT family acetyltransferase [Synechococcus sp. BS55D]
MSLLPFRQQTPVPSLPAGCALYQDLPPSAEVINELLQACAEPCLPPERWGAALERSLWSLSIVSEIDGQLLGFVRATSDRALNANLWTLAVRPGANQAQLTVVLVHRSLAILRRDLPGCSISIAAPSSALAALKNQGFVLDPGGIRAMGLKLR